MDARLYLARASGPSLSGEWQFYDGDADDPWSSDPDASAPLAADAETSPPLTGLSPAITVVADPPGVFLVSQDPMFGQAVTARHADTPFGPFSPAEKIATAGPPSPSAFTYNAILHPELAADGLQLLSWNVNAQVFGDLLADARLYRPRFVAVAWPPVSGTG
jgi:hypothetical protein